MTQKDVLDIGRQTLIIALQLSLPVLLAGLVAGVLVSIFQAVTQIQEFTLTLVPQTANDYSHSGYLRIMDAEHHD